MSDVLVKGWTMPSYCLQCAFCQKSIVYGNLCALLIRTVSKFQARPNDCPLVFVPAHGRVIDADEFLHRAIGTKCFDEDYARMLEELVGESTTVIPAAEDGE